MKYHYVYIITNKFNHKRYVGDHSTNNLSDGYMGSGTLLARDKKIFRPEIFKKEILEFFDTKEEAFRAQEKYIRKCETHVSQGGYNKNWTGGQWSSIVSDETKRKISEACKGKTSHKKYILIDPLGKKYENIVLKEMVRKFNLNFDTLRKHTNKGKIKVKRTYHVKQNTMNCDGWEVIREDIELVRKNIQWIILDPSGAKYELSRGEFNDFIEQHHIDWRTLNRFNNKGKIKIKNKSLSSERTLNTEGWELIKK